MVLIEKQGGYLTLRRNFAYFNRRLFGAGGLGIYVLWGELFMEDEEEQILVGKVGRGCAGGRIFIGTGVF
jgi:hypothetical protein